MNCLGFQQVACLSRVDVTSFTIPANTIFVQLQADDAGGNVRYTMDGTVPTASVGMILLSNKTSPEMFHIEEFRKMIAIGEGSSKLNVQYFGTDNLYPADPGNKDVPISDPMIAAIKQDRQSGLNLP